MDSYRGYFSDANGGYDPLDVGEDALITGDDQMSVEPPPSPVGQDERRMQVRAYNHWASLLGSQALPSVADLSPEAMPDLAPHAVLLRFDQGIEDPRVVWLGDKLAEECDSDQEITRLSDIPGRSLLSRITDHYLQIIANQAPIGFEAEFVNHRGRTVVYRGILLPFSEDGATIDHILGVINWKELADQSTTDALLAEVDKALATPAPAPTIPAPQWAAGPLDAEAGPDPDFAGAFAADPSVLDLGQFADMPFGDALLPDAPLPIPDFGMDMPLSAGGDLAGQLESARALARAAQSAGERSRTALYEAIGRAWDFALAASEAPEEFAALVAVAGLTMQERAPLTPVVKLVFGADYDKTRLTEYASALAYAKRLGFGPGSFAGYLAVAPGGLKGVVQDERRHKRESAGKPARAGGIAATTARKLRRIAPRGLDSFAGDGEFALLLARRLETGEVVLIGEAADPALVARVARRVAG